jgi:hypothetical protein
MPTIAYRVVFEPDDNNTWFVRCPTVGAESQGRNRPEARASIREVIAEIVDADPSTFDVIEDFLHSQRTLERSRRRRGKER